MKQYRMQNRYTNHLPSHFYCRHGIDLNLSCSLCINEECQTRALAERQPPMPSIGAPGDGLQMATRLRNQGSGVLLTNQSVPASDDAGRSDAINERIEQFKRDHELAMKMAIFGRYDAGMFKLSDER